MQSILITGGAGFIGANFVAHCLRTYPDYRLINLDKLTYAGDVANLAEVDQDPALSPRHTLVKGDICNRELVSYLFAEHDIRGVIHFAAESHVDNSIAGPEVFIQTNVYGTFSLLDAARQHWMAAPGQYKPGYEGCRFHHISTDEVYGTLGDEGLFSETTPYAPNSPYSASKAGSDFIARSYFHTYGLETVITNCSNNYGPKQHTEKLIPVIIGKAIAGQPIPIYGDGKNVRDWLYVLDHCKGIDLVYHKGRPGETYNIGGSNEQQNITVARTICEQLDQKHPRADGKSYTEQITFVQDRAGHDRRYAIDASKISRELGWKHAVTFTEGLGLTVDWYLQRFVAQQPA